MYKKHVFLADTPIVPPAKMLRIKDIMTRFAVPEVNAMYSLMTTYSRFAELITDGCILEDPDIDFKDICRRLHVSPFSLDEILVEELGVDGETLVEEFRSQLKRRSI